MVQVLRCLVFGFLALWPLTVCLAAPQVEVERISHDFGIISEGEKRSHTFRFRNSGDETLVIQRIKAPCGCTAALISAREVPPGETADLTVTFNSLRFQGKIRKTVTVYSNAPETPTVTFEMVGQVRPVVSLEPRRLQVQGLVAGKPQTRLVRVANNSQRPLKITGVRTTDRQIEAEMPKKAILPGEFAEIKVRLRWEEKGGRISGYLFVSTDHPQKRQLRLTVRGYPKR